MVLQYKAVTAYILSIAFHVVALNQTELNRAELPRYKLHKKLFKDYNKHVRPVNGLNDSATEVFVSFNLQALVNLDEHHQTMTSIGVLYMQWMDKTLQWDPEEYGHVETLLLNQEDVWVPDINVRNSISQTEQLGYERGPVLVESSGTIIWQPHCVFETLCIIDISYFPFDMQNCSLTLGSRQSAAQEVKIGKLSDGLIVLFGFSAHSQWQLMRTDAYIKSRTGMLSTIKLSVILRRRSTKIVCEIFIPVIFLSIAANLVFLLPIDGGERMSTAVTVLLAYAVYLVIVADSLPMNAMTVSYLELFLLLLLGFATSIAVANVIVVRMERKKGNLRVHFVKGLKRLQRILCLKCCNQRQPAKSTDDEFTNMNKAETQNQTSGKGDDYLTWSQAARLLDRILLIFFTLATFLTTVIFFGILTTGPKEPENNIVTSAYPLAAL